MKVICKYQLLLGKTNKVAVPVNSEVLCVQVQRNQINLWVKFLDKNAHYEVRLFDIRGTGQEWESVEEETYVGTVQKDEFVWHVFEVANPLKEKTNA